jgi:hypothetical protein
MTNKKSYLKTTTITDLILDPKPLQILLIIPCLLLHTELGIFTDQDTMVCFFFVFFASKLLTNY